MDMVSLVLWKCCSEVHSMSEVSINNKRNIYYFSDEGKEFVLYCF